MDILMKIKSLLNKGLTSGFIVSTAILMGSNASLGAGTTNQTTTEETPVVTEESAVQSMEANVEDTAATGETTEETESEFYKNYIKGKLSIGTRIVYRSLTDGDSGAKGGLQGSGTFLGTIYALDEEQNYAPTKIFLGYDFTKYFGIELAWDSMEASTKATSIYSSEIKSDGEVSLYGPTLSLLVKIPNKTQFTPYGGLGIGFFSADFDESADWALGYQGPSHYESLGSPSTPFNGHTRSMEVDSTTAFLLTIGVSWFPTENWFLDLSGQYVKADTDATFTSFQDGVQTGTPQTGNFPMDNFAVRFGIGYRF